MRFAPIFSFAGAQVGRFAWSVSAASAQVGCFALVFSTTIAQGLPPGVALLCSFPSGVAEHGTDKPFLLGACRQVWLWQAFSL